MVEHIYIYADAEQASFVNIHLPFLKVHVIYVKQI